VSHGIKVHYLHDSTAASSRPSPVRSISAIAEYSATRYDGASRSKAIRRTNSHSEICESSHPASQTASTSSSERSSNSPANTRVKLKVFRKDFGRVVFLVFVFVLVLLMITPDPCEGIDRRRGGCSERARTDSSESTTRVSGSPPFSLRDNGGVPRHVPWTTRTTTHALQHTGPLPQCPC